MIFYIIAFDLVGRNSQYNTVIVLTNSPKNLDVTNRDIFKRHSSQNNEKKDKRALLQISALFGILCCPWNIVLKQDLIDIKVTSSFGVNNTANTYPVRLFFFSKCLANYVDSRNALKFGEKCFRFLRNFVWVGRAKISLYWQEYLPSAGSVLTTSPKT